jgi:hypothetical protein
MSMRWWRCQLCTRKIHRVGFSSDSLLKQCSGHRSTCCSTRTLILIPNQPVCFIFLMLRAWWISSKYQFFSLWIGPTGGREPKIYCTRGDYGNRTVFFLKVEVLWFFCCGLIDYWLHGLWKPINNKNQSCNTWWFEYTYTMYIYLGSTLHIEKVSQWDENFVIQQSV